MQARTATFSIRQGRFWGSREERRNPANHDGGSRATPEKDVTLAKISYKLTSSFQGALAGGGDPATSPLYVFGPFLNLIVVAGVAPVTFGASIWMVILTVFSVSLMYRLVMKWVVDGSGGSGLSEEEFGPWAVKINAGITVVEYSLTFMVSLSALVTFVADRFPKLNEGFWGFQYRTVLAIFLSIGIGWTVNRGPKVAAKAFGPATLGVLILLWVMVGTTILRFGLSLPNFDFRAFSPRYIHFTLAGYAHILALMTGIEIFANLVAAYEGTPVEKSRKAFGSLLLVMGTTTTTMVVLGPTILRYSDPTNPKVSVFTQTMDLLLPSPLPFLGTLVGIVVLASAAAASAQGLQNLGMGLAYRHYLPASIGRRNKFEVPTWPVWIEIILVVICFVAFGTNEETYLVVYAAGVFILLSMTGMATIRKLARSLRQSPTPKTILWLIASIIATVFSSGATIIIFMERFLEGAWVYLIFIPVLYGVLTYFRSQRGVPVPLEDQLGRIFSGQYLLPFQREGLGENETRLEPIHVLVDGTLTAEGAIPFSQALSQGNAGHIRIQPVPVEFQSPASGPVYDAYLDELSQRIRASGIQVECNPSPLLLEEAGELESPGNEDGIIVLSGRHFLGSTFSTGLVHRLVARFRRPILLVQPTDDWKSRRPRFRNLLICLDGSPESERILRFARYLGKTFQGTLVLLSVVEVETDAILIRDYLNQVEQALRTRGFEVKTLIGGSNPARSIIDFCIQQDIDLIMMTTHGRGGAIHEDALGSVVNEVTRLAPRPIFIANGRPNLMASPEAGGKKK
jgi:nucleotide-binding universal stress UspA family protein